MRWWPGVDFPAGVYDVETTDEWAYLDFEVPVVDGEEYADYYTAVSTWNGNMMRTLLLKIW